MLFLSVFLLSAVAIAGPLDDGGAALDRGDFHTALKLLQPLAEQGSAEAQFEIGLLYNYGWGVKQDFAEAMKWFRKSADQGDPWAEQHLSEMYAEGLGVPSRPFRSN
jgi:uncharacterized protein